MGRESQANPKLEKAAVLPILTLALKEDLGSRDITTLSLIPKEAATQGEILFREKGIVAGLSVVEWVFGQVDPKIRFKPMASDGRKVFPDKAVAFVEGPARGILMAERVALNFLGRLSGVATLTRIFVERIKKTSVDIMDTRKTTPGLRLLEKYAVAVGGGTPHRMNLSTQVLIKDNHLKILSKQSAGDTAVEYAVKEARAKVQKATVIEVEVNTLTQFRQALAAGADIILLDNMALSDIEESVRLRNAVSRSKSGKKVLLEVSGGITLDLVSAIAAAGVDRISIGALTHSARSLNVALEILG